jgi:transposase
MLPVSPPPRVFLAKEPTDMRRSFRGLLALTEGVLREQPLSGHLFVFVNRRRDLLKILYWDGSGFCIWYKRLERGTFQLPDGQSDQGRAGIELTASQLSLILNGIDLKSAKQRLRYQRPRHDSPPPRTAGSDAR